MHNGTVQRCRAALLTSKTEKSAAGTEVRVSQVISCQKTTLQQQLRQFHCMHRNRRRSSSKPAFASEIKRDDFVKLTTSYLGL